MFRVLLLFALPRVFGHYECNECFCFTEVDDARPAVCHDYDKNVMKFIYGDGACEPLRPGDICFPKVYESLAACKEACKIFLAFAEEWIKNPSID
ncbi:uncharacterized protein Dmoj_GI26524, isoform B [Drosophila mojavensis]|uniref:Uncharacterized protein, isoform B n=1 Tax=Drosophila mojavensis TaxID=7230 RepID=A0A0Q9X4J5_DROMO|nr:uncharacterized protein Dmoj_GI26524, isoform B [Drosophila mojavensis]